MPATAPITPIGGPLDAAQLVRLNQLLEAALDLPDEQRRAWRAALVGEDAQVIAKLDRLLSAEATAAAAAAAEDPVQRPAVSLDLTGATKPDQPGDCIGPYRLIHLLGEGGMASVWLAERDDGAIRRELALKIPHAQWADRGLTERIARECAVLASLNHPNIAQLYDAGWSEGGRPYLALERVRGEPINVHCATLSLRERVTLFVEVLRAVSYAHARLVIHRDFKPPNIMVTAEGRPKLLDFGIAKVLSKDETIAEETELTRMTGRPLSLPYAAPEQFLGTAVTTATDIYALGAMLFELLCGQRACQPREETRSAYEEAIVRGPPPLPSMRADDPETARALRGDLDSIVVKALQKNPEQRYETAAAFADDLERYLQGRAVQARRAGRRYRIQRFVERNRVAVALAVSFVVAQGVALGVAVWQAHLAGMERDHALAAVEHREAVDSFMSDLLQEAGRTGKPVSIPELIERADKISEHEFADSPESRAAVLRTIADFKLDSEGIAASLPYLDRARQLLQASGDSGLRANVGCMRAMLWGTLGHMPEAEATLQAFAADAATPPYYVVDCLHSEAQLLLFGGDGAAAQGIAARALKIWETAPHRSPLQHVELLNVQSMAQARLGAVEAADHGFEQALEELRKLGKERGTLGVSIVTQRQRIATAQGDLTRALNLVEGLIGSVMQDLPGESPLIGLVLDRCLALEELDRNTEALACLRRVAGSAKDSWEHILAGLHSATVLSRLGLRPDAEQAYRQVVDRAGPELDALGVTGRFRMIYTRARLDLDAGRFEEARSALRPAEDLPGLIPVNQAALYLLRARAALAAHATREAIESATRAIAVSEKARGANPFSLWVGEAYVVLGRAQAAAGDLATARGSWERAVEQLAGSLGKEHNFVAEAQALLREAGKS